MAIRGRRKGGRKEEEEQVRESSAVVSHPFRSFRNELRPRECVLRGDDRRRWTEGRRMIGQCITRVLVISLHSTLFIPSLYQLPLPVVSAVHWESAHYCFTSLSFFDSRPRPFGGTTKGENWLWEGKGGEHSVDHSWSEEDGREWMRMEEGNNNSVAAGLRRRATEGSNTLQKVIELENEQNQSSWVPLDYDLHRIYQDDELVARCHTNGFPWGNHPLEC